MVTINQGGTDQLTGDIDEVGEAPRNIGLDLIRVTESAALAAGRWIGSGNFDEAHRAATDTMYGMLSTLGIDGRIVIGEERRVEGCLPLCWGTRFGSGSAPFDLAVDPIDGTRLLTQGKSGAISIVAIAPQNSLWSPGPARYLDKIVVDRDAADVLVPECLDAPAAWTLSLVARAKQKPVRDLTVVVLQRMRHEDLIDEIRATGARILLREEGDAEGAMVAATPGSGVDLLMGVGGAMQGVMSACAVRALGGAMVTRPLPQSAEEQANLAASDFDMTTVRTEKELVTSDQIFFAVTGITDSLLLPGVTYSGSRAETHSLLIRAATGTRRMIHAEHLIEESVS